MKNFVQSFVPSAVAMSFIFFGISCGKSDKNDETTAAPTATPSPTPTESPETQPIPFWLASNSKDGGGPVAVRYEGSGRLSLTVDLFESGIDFGPITAFHFLDPSTLMFFIDPGAGKEIFGTFDVKSGLVKNKAWGAENSIRTAFNSVRAGSLVTGLQANVLHVQTPSGVKSIRYSNDAGGLSSEEFYSASIPAAAACPVGVVTSSSLVRHDSSVFLAVLTRGSATRINILSIDAGVVNCKASLDYAQGPDTTADHKAVSILQNADGKIYVLYQHDSLPMVVRYDFDGNALSSPTKIYSGVSNLGKTPLGLIARTNKRLLIGRPDVGALLEIILKSTGAEQTDFYKKTTFAKDLTALIAEPQ